MMAIARAPLRAPLLPVGILVTMRVILVCVIREGQSTPRVIQLDAFGLSWQGAPGGSAAPALLQPLHGRHLLPGCFVRSVHPEQSFTAAARSLGKAVPGVVGHAGCNRAWDGCNLDVRSGRYCSVREAAWHRLAVWRNFVIPWAGACGASVALASGLRPAFGVHQRPSLLISGTVHREYAAATGRRLCGHAHFRFHVKLFSSPAARRGLVGHITGSFWSMKASGNGVAPVAVGPVATLPTPRSPRREPASKPVRDLGTSAPTAARGQTRAARRPECPCPGNRLTASRRTGKRKARAEPKCIFDRCGQQYGADACTARGEEDARNEPQQSRQVPADHCPRLLYLSAEDGRAFATDEAKVARDCR